MPAILKSLNPVLVGIDQRVSVYYLSTGVFIYKLNLGVVKER